MRHADSHMGTKPALRNKVPNYTRWSHRRQNPRGVHYWSEINPAKKKDILTMVVPPSWGIVFPPYNMARLTALLRKFGYGVVVHDTNIEAHYYLKDKIDYNAWDSIYWDHWTYPNYYEYMHPQLQPFLDDAVQKIIADNTPYVGFSLYSTNLQASRYMMMELKRLKPEVTILVGGPEAFHDWFEYTGEQKKTQPEWVQDIIEHVDVRIIGEGEEMLLSFLDNHDEYPKENGPYHFGGVNSRLDLSQLPFPDYTDYNLNLYTQKGGVSLETSRGCVAKCSFCSETHFWKFRSRESLGVIDEIEHQVKTYNTHRFWFVDSLVNGNMKEFKVLVDELIERELNIRWISYARCDGRMDVDFFHKIKASGCTLLSFGVESGSEKVLTEMKKKILVWEIENNLRDSSIAGIESHVNWVVGFPTETVADWCHSLHVLYNARNWMTVISPGMTCGDAPFSDMNVNWKNYKIAWKQKPWDNTFMSNWYTEDYESTILHRFVRLKYMNQWLSMCVNEAEGNVINAQSRPNFYKFVEFKQNNPGQYADYIPQEANQNFNIYSGNTPQQNLAATLANEHFPHLWIMYKAFGGHSFKIIYDPELDMQEFGIGLSHMLSGEASWSVDDNGQFKFKCWWEFEHISRSGDNSVAEREIVREDMSFPKTEFELTGNISLFDGEVISV